MFASIAFFSVLGMTIGLLCKDGHRGILVLCTACVSCLFTAAVLMGHPEPVATAGAACLLGVLAGSGVFPDVLTRFSPSTKSVKR